MKIDRVSPATKPAARRSERTGPGRAGGFSKTLAAQGGEAAAAPAVSGVGALGPVDAILAAQEVADDPGGWTRGRRRGEDLLDRLDELRLALLEGRLPRVTIERLAQMVASRRGQVDDPRLVQLLDEIELRAAVELAKLGRT